MENFESSSSKVAERHVKITSSTEKSLEVRNPNVESPLGLLIL